jgi:anti-sigma regulatory factor (Ser/Thr protein kinase)
MDTAIAAKANPTSQADMNHFAEQSVLSKSKAIDIKKEPVKITIILPTSAYFMVGIRDFTMNVVQNMTGFPEKWAYRFQSVVDELTNNAIEFGSAPGKDIKITFVSVTGKYIEVFVEDTGTGPLKKTAAEMTDFIQKQKKIDPASITTLRGRGLTQIVSNWTDILEFKDNKDGGLTVHVVKNLGSEEQL